MSERDPFKLLEQLEARVKKAEDSTETKNREIASFENLLRETNEKLAKAEKDADFGRRFRELLAEYGHIYSSPTAPGAPPVGSATVELHDPAQIFSVKDQQQPLVVDTTSIAGQIGQAILEGLIVPEKRYRVGEVAEIQFSHFGGKWGPGQVQAELERLSAAPFRLFIHTIDSRKRHWFAARSQVKERVQKE